MSRKTLELIHTRQTHQTGENAPTAEPPVSMPEASVSAALSASLAPQLDRYLSNVLLQIGIPANKMGYRFLREAVRIALQDPALLNRLMHGLYPLVAVKYNTTVYCVEHSMRMAIHAAWNRGRPELVEKLLGRGVITAYERPTNGELIALLAENARLLMQEGRL